jgi:hypothetical protein
MSSDRTIRPRRRDALLAREVDGETVVLDRVKGVIHRLNPTAGAIWRLCDGSSSADMIAEEVRDAFDVELGTALRDVEAALVQFEELGLIEAVDGTREP